MFEKIQKIQVIILGVTLFFALIFVATIISKTMSQDVINVTGSAYEIVKSDSGTLNFEVNVKAPNKQQAYALMNKQVNTVKKYLTSKGIKDIEIKTITGYYSYKRNANGMDTNVVDCYNMSQPMSIKSNNVELIKEISTDISGLINQGIDISIFDTNYNYSKLADLKVKLLEKASLDAKNRATSILKPARSRIGGIHSVKMGVFQITPVDSTDVSDGGINDTSTIDKKVTAVASVTFKIR